MRASGSHAVVVAVGASAGGVPALRRLAGQLPADLPAAVVVVVHLHPEAGSDLAGILDRAGPLPAVWAEEGMAVEAGRIVVAPPDRHLLVDGARLAVVAGPRENRHRPAIDPLFRSAAWTCGPRAIGVLLTGWLDDGAAGLWAIRSCGGTTVVQDPDDAEYPEMPAHALRQLQIDHRLPLPSIGPLIVRLAGELSAADTAATASPRPAGIAEEIGFARLAPHAPDGPMLGRLSPFTCPACRGALWELDEGGALRYRCHTGHAFSGQGLVQGQSGVVEESLYAAMRALEEKAATLRRLAPQWAATQASMARDQLRRAQEAEAQAGVLRALLAGEPPPQG